MIRMMTIRVTAGSARADVEVQHRCARYQSLHLTLGKKANVFAFTTI